MLIQFLLYIQYQTTYGEGAACVKLQTRQITFCKPKLDKQHGKLADVLYDVIILWEVINCQQTSKWSSVVLRFPVFSFWGKIINHCFPGQLDLNNYYGCYLTVRFATIYSLLFILLYISVYAKQTLLFYCHIPKYLKKKYFVFVKKKLKYS